MNEMNAISGNNKLFMSVEDRRETGLKRKGSPVSLSGEAALSAPSKGSKKRRVEDLTDKSLPDEVILGIFRNLEGQDLYKTSLSYDSSESECYDLSE